jgi:ubiquinol-cytochrome c reductase cytochrome b subunit
MPNLLLLMALVIPFVDTSRKLSWKERPFFTALGITSIGQIIVTTTWGFYVNPNTQLSTLERLFVPPAPYFASMLAITLFSFGVTYAFLRYLRAKERVRKAVAPMSPLLTRRWVTIVLILLIASQLALNALAVQAISAGLNNLALFQVGAVLIAFGVMIHLYRYSQSLPF